MATLEHTHILSSLADWFDQAIGRLDVIIIIIGLISAIVDNVPLVAASMGMYSLEQHPQDSFLWEFPAYCAGALVLVQFRLTHGRRSSPWRHRPIGLSRPSG